MPETLSAEAIVIGGGLAGAATAALLAEKGRDVLLLEKEAQAHHKVCGEFISWEAVHYLEKLGIDLASLGAQPVERVALGFRRHAVSAPLPFRAWSLSRLTLDEALLGKAMEKGARLRRGVVVTALERRENLWQVETATQTLSAPAVFLASGKADLRGWPRPPTTDGDLIGFKMHFRLQDAETEALRGCLDLIVFKGGYAGLELVEDGIANLCLLVRKKAFQSAGKDWAGLLGMLRESSPVLAQRLQDATPLWPKPLAVYAIPYGYIYGDETRAPGLYRLGDQMAVISSFTGDGMAMALHSAFVAAGCFLEGSGETVYHRKIAHDFRGPVRIAGFISALALTETMQPALRLMSAAWPGCLRWAARATRLTPLAG